MLPIELFGQNGNNAVPYKKNCMYIIGCPKIDRWFKKSIKGKHKMMIHRICCILLNNQGIYSHQFSKLVTKLANRYHCYSILFFWSFNIWTTVLLQFSSIEQGVCKFCDVAENGDYFENITLQFFLVSSAICWRTLL